MNKVRIIYYLLSHTYLFSFTKPYLFIIICLSGIVFKNAYYCLLIQSHLLLFTMSNLFFL